MPVPPASLVAVKGTTLVVFQLGDLKRSVVKVIEKLDQVVIVMRSLVNEHVTLHRQPDATLLLTHWSPEKPPGTWDAMRVEAARKLGYRDPDRHADYLTHRPLFPVQGMDGHELCGRRMSLDAATAKSKYARCPQVVLDAPSREFMLTLHLGTSEQPYFASDEPHVGTELGDLYFRANADQRARTVS